MIIYRTNVRANVSPLEAGAGQIVISPGLISLTKRGSGWTPFVGPREVTHTDPSIQLVRTRLEVPWWNLSLFMRGAESIDVIVFLPSTRRKELIVALQDAGFIVAERTVWFGNAWSRSELPRRRRERGSR